MNTKNILLFRRFQAEKSSLKFYIDIIYTQADMVFGYYHCHPKALTLTLSQRERE